MFFFVSGLFYVNFGAGSSIAFLWALITYFFNRILPCIKKENSNSEPPENSKIVAFFKWFILLVGLLSVNFGPDPLLHKKETLTLKL